MTKATGERPHVPCRNCGTLIPPNTRRQRVYCSPKCKNRVKQERDNEKTKRVHSARLLAGLCRACGNRPRDGESSRCVECGEEHREWSRTQRGRRYGMDHAQWSEFRTRPCEICGRVAGVGGASHTLNVTDHHHGEGYLRGALCWHCNVGLGKFLDSPELLRAAAAYVEKYDRLWRAGAITARASLKKAG